MSKAFTKDEGEGASAPSLRPLGPALPAGSKNYLTATGMTDLRERVRKAEEAIDHHRARGEAAQLEQSQQLLEFLTERLAAAEVVAPPESPDGPIRFGATVEAADADGQRRHFRIVGIDEARPAEGDISWTSPMARALLGRSIGESVSVRTPQGFVELEILSVRYG